MFRLRKFEPRTGICVILRVLRYSVGIGTSLARLEAIASGLEAIATRLEVIVLRLTIPDCEPFVRFEKISPGHQAALAGWEGVSSCLKMRTNMVLAYL